ncbi:hypothetical protein BUALT_Bualt19G0104800 [Buddleja alternifolia]|uniref:Uncharacterized protein n=1 Tax=Buddleja alternifolia TaxID=168488 RepID=A0AAV6W6Q0_9LAMI|nr:hypothetical protein BUALT_Bualt19G0104800 [Buddleja alternifolia]
MVVGRCMRKLVRHNHHKNINKILEAPLAGERQPEGPSGSWMPHPRTGMYFPKGQERVMEDIPSHAASFDCTFWLRNTDEVRRLRTGLIKKTKMLHLRPFFMRGLVVGRCMSKLARSNNHKNINKVLEAPPAGGRQLEDSSSCWIPHPRTGIYFPKGQERVMEDIPSDAASFDCTFWLRNTDGVDDKPDPDNSDRYYAN